MSQYKELKKAREENLRKLYILPSKQSSGQLDENMRQYIVEQKIKRKKDLLERFRRALKRIGKIDRFAIKNNISIDPENFDFSIFDSKKGMN